MNGELLFNRYSISVEENERFLEMDGGDVCRINNVNVLSAVELHTSTSLKG